MKEKLINGHQAGLMVGIMLAFLTVNGPYRLRSCLTSPSPVPDRQQPATDSDAWDPLSHIDHSGRVCTWADAHKPIPVQCVPYCPHSSLCWNWLQKLWNKTNVKHYEAAVAQQVETLSFNWKVGGLTPPFPASPCVKLPLGKTLNPTLSQIRSSWEKNNPNKVKMCQIRAGSHSFTVLRFLEWCLSGLPFLSSFFLNLKVWSRNKS